MCVSEKADKPLSSLHRCQSTPRICVLVPVSVPKHVSGIRPILFRRWGRDGGGRISSGLMEAEASRLLFIDWLNGFRK